jgi:hypothetical protein
MAEGVAQGLVPVPGGPGKAIGRLALPRVAAFWLTAGLIALFIGAAAAHEEAEPAKAAAR